MLSFVSYLMSSTDAKKPIPYQEIVKVDHKAVSDQREGKSGGQARSVWSARSEFGVVGEPVFVHRPRLVHMNRIVCDILTLSI